MLLKLFRYVFFLVLLWGINIPKYLFSQNNSKRAELEIPFYQQSNFNIPVPITATGSFLALSITLQGIDLLESEIDILLSGSIDQSSLSKLFRITKDPHAIQTQQLNYYNLFFLEKDWNFLHFKISKPDTALQVHKVLLQFYDPGNSVLSQTSSSILSTENEGCPAISFFTRTDWCPNGNCPEHPDPESTIATHLIVHHSAGSNTSNDWPAVVRSIWNGHVNGFGWDDIGYNWLIDPTGKLYEGRGKDIRGAHFCSTNSGTAGICLLGTFTNNTPTPAAISTLIELLAWYSDIDGINPFGISLHASSGINLNHIAGHRQGCPTMCPGDSFFPMLSAVRNEVADYIENNCISASISSLPDSKISVFPNPNNGIFSIQIEDNEKIKLSVFDLDGKDLQVTQPLKKGVNPINFSYLNPGVYLFRFERESSVSYKKIIKHHKK